VKPAVYTCLECMCACTYTTGVRRTFGLVPRNLAMYVWLRRREFVLLLLRRCSLYSKVKIQKVCSAFSLPTKVQATAITLFKRFLLGTSLLQHNMKVMMLTSIYVACKVEENYVSAEEFGKGMHEDASRVLNAELTLLAGLSFQLVTYSPYRSIEGFRHDIEEKLSAGEEMGKLTAETLDECVAAVGLSVQAEFSLPIA
jgi:cyclin ccl1